MPGRIEKPRGPEEDPLKKVGESDKKRKRESDSTKENQGNSSKKKLSEFERFRRLQQYNTELKALSQQTETKDAPTQPEPSKPLEDTTNSVKAFSISELKPKEVKETTDTQKADRDNKTRMPFDVLSPLSVDLMRENHYMRQEIPRPPQADANKDKGQN